MRGHQAERLTEAERRVLLDPRRRFRTKVLAWRSGGGWAAYRLLDRLFQAQYALGVQRWHRSRGELDPGAVSDDQLRSEVVALRAEYAALQAAVAGGLR